MGWWKGLQVLGDGTLGHYRLIMLLGQGGMGQVWLAQDTRMGRDVALKVLPAELATDMDYRRRFEREAQLAARLRGPHIVPIHNFGELEGRLFIDMELIDGTDLDDVLTHRGAFVPAAAVDMVGQIAAALDMAHDAGLIHRDVKPSNVVVLPSGFAYLIDFGLARGAGQTALTSTGVTVGTWAYMAPERFSGGDGVPSDVYSLACLLFECLTGKRPFGEKDAAQQMLAHMTAPPPRASAFAPGIPAALDEVILRGLAKQPKQRHASAGELAAAARAALDAPVAQSYTPAQGYVPGPSPMPAPVLAPMVPSYADRSLPSGAQGYPPAAPSYSHAAPSYPQQPVMPGYPQPVPTADLQYGPALSYPPGRDVPLPERPRVTAGRVLWWIVLGLSTAFFGFLALVCVYGLIADREASLGTRVAINVVIDVPFAVLGLLSYTQFNKFKRR
ncbi:serine/threonine-protein kinase [Nocardia sp. SYP-A9097]|uniref:serine/threonine-protein kinase n=1 Tax=Nocardia sp. SYP-A9097 TaxID=2663237 RepID=UPI001E35B888|nr:serine/threonine-protein kinase [Nocardia sp. SYP-A9097]